MDSVEYGYCENDCLVVYNYILEELKQYETLKALPMTSTGHVRKDLKNKIDRNYKYLNKVRKSINTDGHVYDLLLQAFAGRVHTCKLDKNRRDNKKCNK